MKYLDADAAVRGFIAETLSAVDVPAEGGGTFNVEVLPCRPRAATTPPYAFVADSIVDEQASLGYGLELDDTVNGYEAGMVLFDMGATEIPVSIRIVAQTDETRSRILAAFRAALHGLAENETVCADYFDQIMVIHVLSFRRMETEEETEDGLYSCLIACRAETHDVELRPYIAVQIRYGEDESLQMED
ncbi:MAG: hypothetical protein C4523_17700 [Myxococcales bacterium]|nr:MAG: hypothetical protein C4523_17700 [Myxococcales bacterium]